MFVNGSVIRLMELFNVKVQDASETGFFAAFFSEAYDDARQLRAPLIHWLPANEGVTCEVLLPDSSSVKGLAEDTFRNVSVGQIVQFERFGFVRVDQKNEKIVVVYAHR